MVPERTTLAPPPSGERTNSGQYRHQCL